MSTEEQRAIWRQKAREQRQRKLAAASGATPPKVVDKTANSAPEFLTVETQKTYVITGGDDTSIVFTRAELEQLYHWWKAERKIA